MECEAKGFSGEGERRRELRWRSCATRDAMLMMHFATSGAAYIHSLALSSSYCSWPRHSAPPVYHSSRHDKLAHIGTA